MLPILRKKRYRITAFWSLFVIPSSPFPFLLFVIPSSPFPLPLFVSLVFFTPLSCPSHCPLPIPPLANPPQATITAQRLNDELGAMQDQLGALQDQLGAMQDQGRQQSTTYVSCSLLEQCCSKILLFCSYRVTWRQP